MSSAISSAATATSTATCVTATPGKYGYVPPDACNSNYNYFPNYGAAIAVTVLFGLVTLAHVVQAFVYKRVSRIFSDLKIP